MNPYTNWFPRQYFLNDDFEMGDVLSIVDLFLERRTQYNLLYDYYIGKQSILNRRMESDKINNKVVNNYGKNIVDNTTNYFLGKPITYTSMNEQGLELLKKELNLNNVQNIDVELGKISSIYGHAFEIHYIDKNGNHRFKYRTPKDVLAIYSAKDDAIMLVAINVAIVQDFKTNTDIFLIDVYTDSEITSYKKEIGKSFEISEVKPHKFGQVPVIEFLANDERQGDFENVISMIDAYDSAVSDSINDISYWNDSYLMLRDMMGTEHEDIIEMKNNRVILVDGSGDAKFITKNVNDTHVNNVKQRLTEDIHKFSACPNLSDESFASNLSGTAIKYKMIGLETKTFIRECKFKLALKKRIELLVKTMVAKNGNINEIASLPEEVTAVFVRNIPSNLVELADIIVKLRGVVSDETLRSQLSFIADLERESKLLEEEKLEQMKQEMEMEMFPKGSTIDNLTEEQSYDGMNEYNLQRMKVSED